uniref:Uncharacterized protein n=1 Tax=Anopheles coluzzii TaxID=1518534 RepID=A0A8W7P0M4_ANOCL
MIKWIIHSVFAHTIFLPNHSHSHSNPFLRPINMRPLVAFLTLLMITHHFPPLVAFIKLIPAGTRIEQNSNIRNVNISCTFHNPKNVLEQSVDCDIDVIRQIKEMKLTVAYYSVSRNVTAQTALLKRQVDLCFFLRNPKSDRMVNLVYQLIMKAGKMPSKCPFGPGLFYVHDFKPSGIAIPPFLPEAEFMLELIYRSEIRAEPVVQFRFYGKLVRVIENVFQNTTNLMSNMSVI